MINMQIESIVLWILQGPPLNVGCQATFFTSAGHDRLWVSTQTDIISLLGTYKK